MAQGRRDRAARQARRPHLEPRIAARATRPVGRQGRPCRHARPDGNRDAAALFRSSDQDLRAHPRGAQGLSGPPVPRRRDRYRRCAGRRRKPCRGARARCRDRYARIHRPRRRERPDPADGERAQARGRAAVRARSPRRERAAGRTAHRAVPPRARGPRGTGHRVRGRVLQGHVRPCAGGGRGREARHGRAPRGTAAALGGAVRFRAHGDP